MFNNSSRMRKVNPFVNALLRIVGEWPLSGSPPLSEQQYRNLFSSFPAFVDYFPIIDYDEETECYLFDDEINVAKIFEVDPRYMCAKSESALDGFNQQLAQALNVLPSDDENPYVAQVYASNHAQTNIGDDLRASINPEWRNTEFTQSIVDMTRQHSDLLTHPSGAFEDSRLPSGKGWRVSEQRIIFVIYRKCSGQFWKKSRKTPAEQIANDLIAFRTAMNSAGLQLSPCLPASFHNWLAPFFGNEKMVTDDDLRLAKETANYDLGQKIFNIAPSYHNSDEDSERGIFKFGDHWCRYLTAGAIEKPPVSGAVFLGEQKQEGSTISLGASIFEKLPVGSIMSFTIIPQTDFAMKGEINEILLQSETGGSREAQYATEQAQQVHEEMLRNGQKVFYGQIGVFVTGNSLNALIDATELTIAEIQASNCISIINPKFDLIAQDSFIRNIPCVYDWKHDRKSSLRARKSYTSHLSSLLPMFGNKSGSNNPCYIMYTRTGQPFYINPFHRDDREKVSHEVFFGPSGSGKSATIFYMTLMSMAVNNPRTFLFDYGNSFKLLGDFAESQGKKVKRVNLTAASEDVLAPFFETQKALDEASKAQSISDGTYKKVESTDSDAEDEERSYLAEMEYILRIMITGGKSGSDTELKQSHLARIQEALIRGLEISVREQEPHARPIHMARAMQELSEEEMKKEGGIPDIALTMRDMADAIKLWTNGLRGMLFNRTATGFSPDYDLTIIEIGSLGKTGGNDMLAVAGLSAIYNITALAEEHQYAGRSIEIKIDEAHLWAKVPMLMSGLNVAAKVFRKLNAWLCVITQDVSDFSGDARKILTNSEFWWLMKMSDAEIEQITEVLTLDDEVKHLIRFPTKEEKRFVEGVSISAKFPDTLVRYVPPSLILALAQTDGREKNHRKNIMDKHQCSELEAAYIIADEIETSRKKFQQQIQE